MSPNNPLAFIDPLGLRALSALETSAVNLRLEGVSIHPNWTLKSLRDCMLTYQEAARN